jgi:AraC family transcriptional activator of mtrCDE
MDTVSRLIRLARPEGSVDVRCLLAGQFLLDNPASRPGKAPFHLLLEGRCAVEYRGRTIQLCAGDVVLFPHGGAHRVLVEHGAEPVEAVEKPGVAFPTLQSHGAGAEIDLFCGHYSLAPGAGELLFRTLPEPLHVSFGTDADDPVRMLSTLMRQEAQANGPGTAAIVSSLCDALLAMVLRSSPRRRVSDDVLWT